VTLIRSILRAFGDILPAGPEAACKVAREHGTENHLEMPESADGILGAMRPPLNGRDARGDGLTGRIGQSAWLDADARRPMRMPGIGPGAAPAIATATGDARRFETGRGQAARPGPTPRTASNGCRARRGRITKTGDRCLRKATDHRDDAALMAKTRPETADRWTAKLPDRTPLRLATPAMTGRSALHIACRTAGPHSPAERPPHPQTSPAPQ